MASQPLYYPGSGRADFKGRPIIRPPDFAFPMLYLLMKGSEKLKTAEREKKACLVIWFLRELLNFESQPLLHEKTLPADIKLFETHKDDLRKLVLISQTTLEDLGYEVSFSLLREFLVCLEHYESPLISTERNTRHLRTLTREQKAMQICSSVDDAIDKLKLKGHPCVYANAIPYIAWKKHEGKREARGNKNLLNQRVKSFLADQKNRAALEKSVEALLKVLPKPKAKTKCFDFRAETNSNFDVEEQPFMSTERPNHLLFFGPPGTGKTREAKRRASAVISLIESDWKEARKQGKQPEKWLKQVSIVQFHPGYTYEEFIEGIRPLTDPFGEIKYEIVYGPFMKAYTKARHDFFPVPAYRVGDTFYPFMDVFRGYDLNQIDSTKLQIQAPFGAKVNSLAKISFDTSKIIEMKKSAGKQEKIEYMKIGIRPGKFPEKDSSNHVLIIDELNRAKVSKVIGELLYAIADMDDDRRSPVKTLYSKTELILPSNLQIFATMNNTDQSVDDLDQALLRRFTMVQMYPNYEILARWPKKSDRDSEATSGPTVNTIFRKYCSSMGEMSEWLKKLNRNICKIKESSDFQIGHTYFLDVRHAIDRAIKQSFSQARITEVARREILSCLFLRIVPTVRSLLRNETTSVNSVFDGLLNLNAIGDKESFFAGGINSAILAALNDKKPISTKIWNDLVRSFLTVPKGIQESNDSATKNKAS